MRIPALIGIKVHVGTSAAFGMEMVVLKSATNWGVSPRSNQATCTMNGGGIHQYNGWFTSCGQDTEDLKPSPHPTWRTDRELED